MFAHGGSAVPLGVYLLRWCGEKENSLAVLHVIFAVGNFLIRGLTRRLRRGVQVQSRGAVNSLWQTNRGGAGGERKAPASGIIRQLCRKQFLPGADAPTPARTVGLPHRGGKYFLSKRKKVPKKAGGTATPEAAHGSPSGCPRARGVRCRIAPCRSLCSPPTLPAGRFGLRPRPHGGHASLRDSSLPSPAGKKPYIAHF